MDHITTIVSLMSNSNFATKFFLRDATDLKYIIHL